MRLRIPDGKRLCALLFLSTLLACGKANEEQDGAERLKVAVIPKGTTHEFWKSIHAGARKAEMEGDSFSVIWRGPEREDDREQQIQLVQNFVSQKVDGIVLAPLDQRALLPSVQAATRRGIPVVIIDSGLDGVVGKDFVSYVATDNKRGGVEAGRYLAQLLNGKGRVLMLRYAEGSESTAQREEGFVESVGEFPELELIDPGQYAGPTRATAQKAAENLLSVHTEIDGIFCSNESATFGMLLALRSRNKIDQVKFVGFDASEGLVQAMEAGDIQGLVVQNPLRMGYEGVQTLLQHLRGGEVLARVDTGVALVTPDNMQEPAMRDLLQPDLDQYLKN